MRLENFVLLTSSQGTLMLLFQGPHFENGVLEGREPNEVLLLFQSVADGTK